MAIIKISELAPAGSDLFQDSESFLNELTEQETNNLLGGGDLVATIQCSDFRFTVWEN